MRIRRSCLVLVVLLIPARARPSGHDFDMGCGVSRVDGKQTLKTSLSGAKSVADPSTDEPKVYGWHLVAAKTFHSKVPKPGPDWMKRFAIVGDVSGHYKEFGRGLTRTRDIQQITFMLGPRYEIPVPVVMGRLMVHVLPFGFRFDNQDNTQTAVVVSVGGSWELKFHKLTEAGYGVRVVYDRLLVRNVKDQNRVSLILSRRFGGD